MSDTVNPAQIFYNLAPNSPDRNLVVCMWYLWAETAYGWGLARLERPLL